MKSNPDSVACASSLLLATALALAQVACGGGGGVRAYGEEVDVASARPLAEVLARRGPGDGDDAPQVVRGRVAEVCPTSGCWFALQDVGEDGKLVEIRVDLAGSATFTVPQSLRGRTVVVRGRIVERSGEAQLAGVGLVVEPR